MGSTRIIVSVADGWVPEDDEPDAFATIESALQYDKIPAHMVEQDEAQTALERAAPDLLAFAQDFKRLVDTGALRPQVINNGFAKLCFDVCAVITKTEAKGGA